MYARWKCLPLILLVNAGCDQPTFTSSEPLYAGVPLLAFGPSWGSWSQPVNLTTLNSPVTT